MVKGVPISLDLALLSHIAAIPNEGPTITFDSTSRIIFRDDDWKHGDAWHRIGIRLQPNTRHSRNIWNSNDLSPRMRAVSGLLGGNLVSQSWKSLNKLRVIDIYLMDRFLSASPINLACIIMYCMRDTVSTNKSERVLSFLLLLTNILCHFSIDLKGEQQEHINGSDIILVYL